MDAPSAGTGTGAGAGAGTGTGTGTGAGAGHGPGKTAAVSATSITPLPNHGCKLLVSSSTVQTLNGGIMNSHNSGSSTVPLVGTPSTNTVIQTSFVNNSQSVVTPSSSQAASLVAGGGPTTTVRLVRPSSSMQTAGGTTSNGNNNNMASSCLAVKTCTNAQLGTSAPAPALAMQSALLDNGRSPPSSVSVSAGGSQIIRAEAPKTIIQTTAPPQSLAPRTFTPVPGVGCPGGIRAVTPQVLAPRHPPQASPGQPNVQNIQLPPGMVLVRSESGQLLMIHQQTLAQMQAQSQSQSQSQSAMAPHPATPTNTHPVQITSVQAPGTPLLTRQVTPTTTIIKQGSPAQTPATTMLQRPPVLKSPVGAAVPGATQRTVTVATGNAVASATAETMENVKKCKNFLSTLIKLASSVKQSSETAANVKDLVKDLLEGKLEAEEFTSRLYRELNSSPQPYLVPFLKRSLPALRQLTPDSTAFIQQSGVPQQASAPTSVVLGSPAPRPAAPVIRPHLQPVISKQGQPAPLVLQPQQQGATVRPPQVTLATTPMVTLRGQPPSRIMLGQSGVQVKQLQTVPMVKPGVLPGSKFLPGSASLAAAQKMKLKEAAGTYRDDDDINDVASMAGVNLSEESARILATNSELVGAVTRSCKDEAFLYTPILQRRMLEMGKKFGVTELGPEVVNYVSHAAQQRLRNLLETVSEVAQHKNINFKEDSRYEQTSDVRAQLKFFEQLDQMERQRKEEQEREILMKAAKSRARQEDPEQLRLKQKAKEMQQAEQFQLRQREANLTALAAIGPRKKRKLEAAASAAAEGSGSSPSLSGGAGVAGSRQFTRQRITRINLRDLLFCLENEKSTSRSHLLYRGFLK